MTLSLSCPEPVEGPRERGLGVREVI